MLKFAVAVCMCKAGAVLVVLSGKGRALHRYDYIFYFVGTIVANYWEGKRDFSYEGGQGASSSSSYS